MNESNRHMILMERDFRNFLYYVWRFLGLPPPTECQYEIAYYLQHGDQRKMIEAFRGIGKSWITSAYVLWVLRFVDPDYKFLVTSASKSRSDDFSSFTKRLISEMPLLNILKPDPNKDQRDSMIAFDVGPAKPAHAPSVKSVGIFGQLTGSRANEIVADDIEVANNSATLELRQKLEKASKEFEAIIVPGGRITFLGTPQTEESIYNRLPDRGYTVWTWPSRFPSQEKIEKVYKGSLAPSLMGKLEVNPGLVGEPTDTRFSDEELLQRELSMGRSDFLLQYMLDTSLSDIDRYPLKLSDFIVLPLTERGPVALSYATSPEYVIRDFSHVGFTGDRMFRPLYVSKDWIEFEGSVMSIDPSGRGSDELAYAVIKQLHGYLFLTACGGLKGGYTDENLKKLGVVAREQKVNAVVVEDNFGDGMFTKILTPVLTRLWPCSIEDVKHHIQKEKRIIDTLEPVMNRHRLVIDEKLIKEDTNWVLQDDSNNRGYSLFYQLTRVTKDRGALTHDDRLDALAMAVKYFTDSMARDEVKVEDDYREEVLMASLEQFIEDALDMGVRTKTVADVSKDTWIHIPGR